MTDQIELNNHQVFFNAIYNFSYRTVKNQLKFNISLTNINCSVADPAPSTIGGWLRSLQQLCFFIYTIP